MRTWHKCRRWLQRRREHRDGWAYHRHAYQIIVSKQELTIQLQAQERHENLVYCLAWAMQGRNTSDGF